MHYILVVMLLNINVASVTYQEFDTVKACHKAEKDILTQFLNTEGHGKYNMNIFCEAKSSVDNISK